MPDGFNQTPQNPTTPVTASLPLPVHNIGLALDGTKLTVTCDIDKDLSGKLAVLLPIVNMVLKFV